MLKDRNFLCVRLTFNVTSYFSGPGTAVGRVCLCVSPGDNFKVTGENVAKVVAATSSESFSTCVVFLL